MIYEIWLIFHNYYFYYRFMKNKAHKLLGLIMLTLSCVSDAKFEAIPFHEVEMKRCGSPPSGR